MSPLAASTAADAFDVTNLSLEELGAIKVPTVVGASKYEQKVTEAPSLVSVVTREDIQAFGYRTLGDLLGSVRGFYVTTDRIYNYTGLRGVNRPGDFGGRVLINVDGHRLNEPIYDSAFTSTDFILDLDLVERVEVVRGPGSSLYGNNAFFTVINVVTRRAGGLKGGEVSASAGSLDTHSGRVSHGHRFQNGLEMLVSGSYFESAGQDQLRFEDHGSNQGGVVMDHDGTRARSGFVQVTYHQLRFEAAIMERQRDNPTAQYGSVFNDPTGSNLDRRAYAELNLTQAFAQDWTAQSRLYYDYYLYDSAFAFADPAAPAALIRNVETSRAQWFGGEALLRKVIARRHHVILGAEFRRDGEGHIANFDVAPFTSYVDARRTATTYAAYGQADLVLRRDLTLNAGLRYDRFSGGRHSLNPRGALNYHPWRDGSFKLIYGQAFRAPNLYERAYIQPSFKTNPALSTEKIRSYEFGYEQALPGNLRCSGSIFATRVQGLIGQLTDASDGLNTFGNLDAVTSRGFELELEGRWAHGVRSRASYTYAEAKDAATGRRLENSPRHLAKALLAFPLASRVSCGLEAQAMSRRTTVAGAEVGPTWVAHATLFSRELVPGFEFSAGVYNLFNRTLRDPVSPDFAPIDTMPTDGRLLRLTVTRRF